MLERVTVTGAALDQLRGARAGLEIVDNDGNVIGVFIPQGLIGLELAEADAAEHLQNEKRHSTADVLSFIESFPDVSG